MTPRLIVLDMSYAKAYNCLAVKSERKGRARDEWDQVIIRLLQP